jgi:hypothetical protein
LTSQYFLIEDLGENVALLFLSFCDIETVLSIGCVCIAEACLSASSLLNLPGECILSSTDFEQTALDRTH